MSMTKIRANNADKTAELIAKHIIPLTSSEVVKILPKVKGNSHQATCRKLYDFCKRNYKYVLDDPGYEEIRSPIQTIKDRKADCEDYSILIASCLLELNYPASLRIVDYGDGFGWSHIYVISKGIVIDPVNGRYNTEPKHIKKKDYQVNGKSQIIFNTAKSYGLGRISINPVEARKNGSFYESGNKYTRQPELKNVIIGKKTNVSFSFDIVVKGYYAIIPAEMLQPSHLGNIENPLHFIPEARQETVLLPNQEPKPRYA